MIFYLGYVVHSDLWVLLQQQRKQTSKLLAPVFGVVGLFVLNFVEHVISVFVEEGRDSRHQLVDEAAETPPVDCLAVSLLLDDFGSHVLWGSTEGEFVLIPLYVIFGEAEISQLDVSLSID